MATYTGIALSEPAGAQRQIERAPACDDTSAWTVLTNVILPAGPITPPRPVRRPEPYPDYGLKPEPNTNSPEKNFRGVCFATRNQGATTITSMSATNEGPLNVRGVNTKLKL